MNNNDQLKKNPELYIDGQKINFHYNREERLNKSSYKIKSDDGFFGKKNRSLHIIILNLILLFIIGFIFTKLAGRSVSHVEKGFKFYFLKKNYYDSPILDFRIQIKNITKNKNILDEDYRNMDFKIYDENENIIHSKLFYIQKNAYDQNEYNIEYIIVEKPKKDGKYKAVIYYGPDKTLNLPLLFMIKNK